MKIDCACVTRELKPTNTLGKRISCTVRGKLKRVIPWDYRLNQVENHRAACYTTTWIYGGDVTAVTTKIGRGKFSHALVREPSVKPKVTRHVLY